MLKYICCLFTLFLLPSLANANTYWMSINAGNDSNTCFASNSDPGPSHYKKSFVAGTRCLTQPGDTLYMRAGTYPDIVITRDTPNGDCESEACIPSGSSPSVRTTVSAAPGEERQVVIIGVPMGTAFTLGGHVDYTYWKGLKFNCGDNDYFGNACHFGMTPGVGASDGHDPLNTLFENNEVFGSFASCVLTGNNMIWRFNEIHHCGSPGSNQDQGIYTGDYELIEYNTFHHNYGNGLQIYATAAGCLGSLTNPCHLPSVIRYNYCHDNVLSCMALWQVNGGSQVYGNVSYNDYMMTDNEEQEAGAETVYNNTAVFDDGRDRPACFQFRFIWVGYFRNNLCVTLGPSAGVPMLHANPAENGITESNSVLLTTDPFVDYLHGNFQLKPGSAPINAGATWPNIPNGAPAGPINGVGTAVTFNIDANGVTRGQGGSAWDVGACEWFSGAVKCPNFVLPTIITPPSPTVSITVPTSNPTFTATSSTIALGGTVSVVAPGATITSITWSCNICGSGNATVTGGTWSVPIVTLVAGVNNITVTARDSNSQIATASIAVTLGPSGGVSTKRSLLAGTSVDQNIIDAFGPVPGNYSYGCVPPNIMRGPFFPMVSDEASAANPTELAACKANGDTLLTVNEPDGRGISVGTVLGLWPGLQNLGMRLGSPSVSTYSGFSGAWLDDFMTQSSASGFRVDFINVHYYPFLVSSGLQTDPVGAAAEFIRELNLIHSRYPTKPIWITEFALSFDSSSGATIAQQLQFMQIVLPQLEALSFVEKYMWWTPSRYYCVAGDPGATNCLADANGNLNSLGIFYRDIMGGGPPPPPPGNPTISISAPTASPTFITSSSTIAVSGIASCPSGFTGITWSNNRGGGGAATGTTSWTVTGITLVQDRINTLTFTVNCSGSTSTSATLQVRANGPSVPVLLLAMDENQGTVATDISGKGNNAVFAGTGNSWAPGKYGSAISFNGNGYLSIAHSNSLDLSLFTVEMEVFPTQIISNFAAVFATNYSYYLYSEVPAALYCGGRGPLGGMNDTVTEIDVCSGSALPLNQWSHLAVTYDGAALIFYVNGSPTQTIITTMLVRETTDIIRVGGSIFGEFFIGRLDNLRVFNTARSAAQIVTDMNTAISAPVTPTVAQFSIGSQGVNIGSVGVIIGGP